MVQTERKINNDRLGLGMRRGITVTVTTTPSSLATLLNAATTGRGEMPNRRQLNLRNNSATEKIFILEAAAQTVAEGVQIRVGEERPYEISITGTNNTTGPLMSPADDISKTLFATSANTAAMTVEEIA